MTRSNGDGDGDGDDDGDGDGDGDGNGDGEGEGEHTGTQIRADIESMLNSCKRSWKGTAAVSKSHTKARKAFEDAAEDHRANRTRGLSRHP